MRALGCALMTFIVALCAPALALAQSPGQGAGPHIAMRLVAESDTPRAGSPVTLALDARPQPGWHGYWKNPGDAGLPAQFRWTLPRGAVVEGEPRWPVPTTLLLAGLMNYVYEAPFAPLMTLRVPAGLASGTPLPVRLAIDYLVCTTAICVPEQQTLALDLVIGDGAPGNRAAFDAWRAAIPRSLDLPATYAFASGDGASPNKLTISVPFPAGAALSEPYFFPTTGNGAIDYAAPQTVTRDGDRLLIATRGKPADAIDGVLRIGPAQGLTIHALRGDIGAVPDAGGDWLAALAAFAGALLGGLILNVMPCVFPILSLKALSLARANTAAQEAQRDALAYAAGVVLVCLALGGAILTLRAGGSTVGWAFQLQDPRAILVLLLLSVGIALNLSGLFEVPMPRFAGSAGASGSFATGALAAFIATPCSGPFMGAALGAALVLPWYAALAVFAGLGIGLALPFLLIGFVPALRQRLPRPGAWMERFRRALAVPMWLTAWALAWVLGRQAGVEGMTQGIGACLALALLLWVAGRRQLRGFGFGAIVAVLIAFVVVGGAATVTTAKPVVGAPADAEPFTEARLAALRREGRPVFAYFTADWCLSCKVNEKAAIETTRVRTAFAKNHVAVLVGDWTSGDATLGRFIQQHNRAGVPLYLFYPRGGGEPRVLPQVLTSGMLESLK